MKEWLHKTEVAVDKLIPYMLVMLLAVIALEIGYPHTAEKYALYVQIADGLVIGIFLLDLVFKYIRVRNMSTFLKKYWLDIIAVFPFFLLFRGFEEAAGILSRTAREEASTAQQILHSSAELEKTGGKLVAVEAATKEVGKLGRTEQLARFIRPLLRTPRFAKALHFFEKPTGKHHRNERKR